ncbi:hypothetical protein TKK_0004132 [Trichogramma kaykai]|uniref:Folded gastrulation N-terminal domain-containing protein n=1 Tax=Trichogramma kaykai TaxID=54128 RepID=A0ABD2XLL1_9HYME
MSRTCLLLPSTTALLAVACILLLLAAIAQPSRAAAMGSRRRRYRDDVATVPSSVPTLQRKSLMQGIGSPSELAWQAWLLVENKNVPMQSSLDSSNILRRITPKSIFIAPDLISCPDGYTADSKGVCKPNILKIDEDAQREFFLKRLNTIYGKTKGNSTKKPNISMLGTGPFQISIPISMKPEQQPKPAMTWPAVPRPIETMSTSTTTTTTTAAPSTTSTTTTTTTTTAASQQQPTVGTQIVQTQDPVAEIFYKVANETGPKLPSVADDLTSFFLGSPTPSTPRHEIQELGQVVPIVPILDSNNESVVKYTEPIIVNATRPHHHAFEETRITDDRPKAEKKIEDVVIVTPTPDVLTIWPTKLPFSSTTKRHTEAPEEEEDEKTTASSQEETRADSTIQTVAPLEPQQSQQITSAKIRLDDHLYPDATRPEPQRSDEYDETSSSDDFTEGEDELLKAGEAGAMIQHAKNHPGLLLRPKLHRVDTSDESTAATTTLSLDEAATTLPTVTPDSSGINDSTASITGETFVDESGDFTVTTEEPTTIMTTEASGIMDDDNITTVEDTSDDKLPTETTSSATVAETKSPVISAAPTTMSSKTSTTTTTTTTSTTTTSTSTTPRPISSIEDDLKELFEAEKDLLTEPEVVLSTQIYHGLTGAYGQRLPTAVPTRAATAATEPLRISTYRVDETTTVVRTEIPPVLDYFDRLPSNPIKQQPAPLPAVNGEHIIFRDDSDIPFEFKEQMSDSARPVAAAQDTRRVPSSVASQRPSPNDPEAAYVRYPELSHYLKFPSDDVNSIHNLDSYKDRSSPYRVNLATSSTKSSVPARQKPVSLSSSSQRLPLRSNRQNYNNSRLREQQLQQKPMLLRFWAKMPLIRELDLTASPTSTTTSYGGGGIGLPHRNKNEPFNSSSNEDPFHRQFQAHRMNSRFAKNNNKAAAPRFDTNLNGSNNGLSLHEVNRLLQQHFSQSQPAIVG